MRTIPVGASAAMLFSLLVAFVVSPWAALRLLGRHLQGPSYWNRRPRTGGPGSMPHHDAADPTKRNRCYFLWRAVLFLISVALDPWIGAGEDAAIRQQERTASCHQYARRHAGFNRQRALHNALCDELRGSRMY